MFYTKRRRKGTRSPATMNILVCPLQQPTDPEPVFCPGCHSHDHCKHGVYTRKGFHIRSGIVTIPTTVQRYRCRNMDCPRCTFSVLPPMVLRYCRFFWPCLLAVKMALVDGLTCYHIARHVWQIGREVVRRAAALFDRMSTWVRELHRETTDGCGIFREVGLMVKIITRKIGHSELSNRWYRHHYPLRF